MTKEIFENSPLDEEEQWYEDHFDEFCTVENQKELRLQAMETAKQSIDMRLLKGKYPVFA